MKLVKSVLAASILALASGQSVASTVNITMGMSAVTVGTANGVGVDPNYYELNVGSSSTGEIGTYITLIDTDPEWHIVNYDLYFDTISTLGSYAIGSLVESWSYTDVTGNSNLTHFVSLLANTQYVLKMHVTNADNWSSSTQISAVPLPGAALLFGSVLLGAGALRRKQAKAGEMAAV